MDLSIIIVNWNSLHYLKKCIASILSQTRFINYEIVVIDNASFDGTDEELRRHYPEVRFIQSSANLGFARANNEAFKISVGRNIVFLNPDTEIKNNALGYLMKCLDTEPEVGVVGAKLFNSDGSVQRSCIRVFPTILNCVADFDRLINYFPHLGFGVRRHFSSNPFAVIRRGGFRCLLDGQEIVFRTGWHVQHRLLYVLGRY